MKFYTIIFSFILFLSSIEVSSQVLRDWVRIYSISSETSIIPKYIFIDDNEKIYLAGNRAYYIFGRVFSVVTFNSTGDLLWSSSYPFAIESTVLNAAAMDANTNIILTGRRGDPYNNIFTSMFSNTGQIVWGKSFSGVSGFPNPASDYGHGVATDSNGFIYVTGTSTGMGTLQDYILIKYDQQGDSIWTRRYHGTGLGDDVAYDIACDGNFIYITGNSYGASSLKDIVTVKYNSEGDEIWVQRFDYATRNDEAKKIIIDSNGDIIVAGTISFSNGNLRGILLKYSSSGELIWNTIINNSYLTPVSIMIDNDNNIIYAASYLTTSAVIMKFSENGEELWSQNIPVTYNQYYNWVSIDCDSSGNVYLASNTGNQPVKTYLVKLSPSGSIIWNRSFQNQNYSSYLTSIKLASNGNIYVAGQTDYNLLLIKYSQHENIVLNPFSLVLPSSDTTINLNDMSDSVLFNWNRSNISPLITYKIRMQRSALQAIHYIPSGNSGRDSLLHLNKNLLNNIVNSYQNTPDTLKLYWWVVASNSEDSLNSMSSRTINLTGFTTGILSNEIVPSEFSLLQNYPNPFNPITKITFGIAEVTNTKLLIFDITGKEVAKIVDKKLIPGTYEINFDGGSLTSGVYFYTLKTERYEASRKMLLLK